MEIVSSLSLNIAPIHKARKLENDNSLFTKLPPTVQQHISSLLSSNRFQEAKTLYEAWKQHIRHNINDSSI